MPNTNTNTNAPIHNSKQLRLHLKTNQPNIDYTIMRSGMRFYSTKVFNIPSPIVYEYFSTYNLLYWSAKHTYHRIIEGFITKDNMKYQVVFNGMTRGTLLSMIQNDCEHMQIPISFRAPNPEWNLPAIAMIGIPSTF